MLNFLQNWISEATNSKLVRIHFLDGKRSEPLDLIAVDQLGIVLFDNALDDFAAYPWTAINSIAVISDWHTLPLPSRVLEAQAKWHSN